MGPGLLLFWIKENECIFNNTHNQGLHLLFLTLSLFLFRKQRSEGTAVLAQKALQGSEETEELHSGKPAENNLIACAHHCSTP